MRDCRLIMVDYSVIIGDCRAIIAEYKVIIKDQGVPRAYGCACGRRA